MQVFRHRRDRWQTRPLQTIELDVELAERCVTGWKSNMKAGERARIILETLKVDQNPLFAFHSGSVRLYRDDHTEECNLHG